MTIQVNCLFVDSADRIWVGNNGGISITDGNQTTGYNFQEELSKVSVRCLLIKDEKLYMGSRSDGLFCCSLANIEDTIKEIRRIGDRSWKIRDLMLHKGQLLVASDHGLRKLAGDSLVSFQGEFDKLNVSGIDHQDNDLWISTIQSGVFHYASDTITIYNEQNGGIRTNKTRSVIIDKNGEPWVGTRTGLEHFKGTRFITFSTNNGLLNDNIKVVYEDLEGDIWIGSDGAGIFKFSGYRFIALTEKDGLASDLVMSFTEDSSGVWVATYGGGISYYKGDQILNYEANEMLSNRLIWCSAKDKSGRVWFGTSKGVTINDKKGVHPFQLDKIIDNSRITSLIEHDGRMFIGHRNGLAAYSDDSVHHFDVEFKSVRAMHSSADGGLLIGSSTGIFVYKNNTIKKLGIDNDKELYPAYSIAYLDSNNFWVGNPNGLFMVSDGKATKISAWTFLRAQLCQFFIIGK